MLTIHELDDQLWEEHRPCPLQVHHLQMMVCLCLCCFPSNRSVCISSVSSGCDGCISLLGTVSELGSGTTGWKHGVSLLEKSATIQTLVIFYTQSYTPILYMSKWQFVLGLGPIQVCGTSYNSSDTWHMLLRFKGFTTVLPYTRDWTTPRAIP